jgi:hypothetical protein
LVDNLALHGPDIWFSYMFARTFSVGISIKLN